MSHLGDRKTARWRGLFQFVSVSLLLVSVAGCDTRDIAGYALEKSLSFALVEECGDDPACVAAVDEQLGPCMDASPAVQELLQRLDENLEGTEQQMAHEVFLCIVDADGDSYFMVEFGS